MMLTDRLKAMQGDLRERARDARLERTSDRNDLLEAENEVLRTELAQDRKDRARLLSVLGELDHQHPKQRGRRVLGAAVVAGTAYVLGTRAGRERYEQLRAWWGRLLRSRRAGDIAESADGTAQPMSGETDRLGRDVQPWLERGA